MKSILLALIFSTLLTYSQGEDLKIDNAGASSPKWHCVKYNINAYTDQERDLLIAAINVTTNPLTILDFTPVQTSTTVINPSVIYLYKVIQNIIQASSLNNNVLTTK